MQNWNSKRFWPWKRFIPSSEYLTFEYIFLTSYFSVLALVCVVCGQEDPLAALGKSLTANIFAKSPETRVYLMINAPNNPVQWKMLRRFPGPLQSQLVTTEREMTCRHHRHCCHQFRMDFATRYWSNSPRPTFSLDKMFTLTPYEHLPSKYKLLICCKNVYHMTALINHKNQQSFSEQNIIFSAQNIPGVPGEDYPIFVLPPETQFDCNEQIEGEKLLKIFSNFHFLSLQGTMRTLMPTVRLSTSALLTAAAPCSSTASSAPTAPCSTSSTSSATGGSTWTAPRPPPSTPSTPTSPQPPPRPTTTGRAGTWTWPRSPTSRTSGTSADSRANRGRAASSADNCHN